MDPENFFLLLQAFYYSLRLGIISKEEVVSWADNIIKEEDGPDYFFIEVSLSHDKNELLSILREKWGKNENVIAIRIALALLYEKLSEGAIDANYALGKIVSGDFMYSLTSIEVYDIYSLDEYYFYQADTENVTREMLQFLSRYKDLSWNSPNHWGLANKQIEIILEEERIKEEERIAAWNATWKKEQRRVRLKKITKITIISIVTLSILVINIFAINGVYSFLTIAYANIFGFWFLGKVAYISWRNKRRK
ncbi:MAG: hypothetical protein ACTHJ8_07440 [Mucilaginibacter sp.]